MKLSCQRYLKQLEDRYPGLKIVTRDIESAFEIMAKSYQNGGKILVGGNGGSAADSEHIVGELMKSFIKKRTIPLETANRLREIDSNLGENLSNKLQGALPTISLVGHPGLSTAYLNDVDPVLGFAQQVYGLGREGDTLLAITTSGNSQNIIYAAIVAKALGMQVIALTGRDGGKIKEFADVSIIVAEEETYKIQELHLPIYHVLCLMLEEEFFAE